MRSRRILLLAAALLVTLAGCAEPTTMVAGASLNALEYGVTTWSRRALEAAELAPIQQARDAAHRTLEELEFKDIDRRDNSSGLWTRLWTADQQGRSVTVTLTAVSPSVTKMKIRVGFLGDQAVSIALHREIQKRINAATHPGGTPGSPREAAHGAP
jgi:Protein of unknown function (DUF3568)